MEQKNSFDLKTVKVHRTTVAIGLVLLATIVFSILIYKAK